MNGSKKIKISFLLLCHGSLTNIKELLEYDYFLDDTIRVYIHYDLKSSKSNSEQLQSYANKRNNLHFVENRVVCKWGMYSLVRATLNMMQCAIDDNSFEPDYIYLISSACRPIKPISDLKNFLFENKGIEFIEAYDVRTERWVTDGWDKERYQYYFPFCWYGQRSLFEISCRIQEFLRLNNRKVPVEMNMYFGSQWFCLTANTCRGILEQMKNRKLEKFFRWSWIPDEFAIQSLVVLIAGKNNVANKGLTYYQFNSYGRPINFYNDHIDYVKKLNFFFARKFSQQAKSLKLWLKDFTSRSNKIDTSISLSNIGVKPKNLEIFQKLYSSEIKQSKIGTHANMWSDGLDKNNKTFYVLTGTSKSFLNAIVKKLSDLNYVAFSYIFDHSGLNLKELSNTYGIKPKDIDRRDFNPTSFLYQIVNITSKPTLFCFDTRDDPEWIRELIKWSEHAKVIVINPKFENNYSLKVSSLREDEANVIISLDDNDLLYTINLMLENRGNKYWKGLEELDRACEIIDLTCEILDHSKNKETLVIDLMKIVKNLKPSEFLSTTKLGIIKRLKNINE